MRPDIPPFIASPSSYLEGALEYKSAVDILLEDPSRRTPIEPLGFLAAHSAELALKALLLGSGVPEPELRGPGGHDLNKLWQLALDKQIPIEEPAPFWCEVLAVAHANSYTFRYRREHWGVGIPEPEVLRDGLQRLLDVATLQIR